MSIHDSKNHLRALYNQFVAGAIDRRAFVKGATALGISATGAVFLANTGVRAQDASPESSPAMMETRPDAGTEGQERGAGGDLRLIQWQAPTSLSPHLATGSKDFLGAMLVVEPLMHYAPDSSMIPNLVTEVPSAENGMLADDLTSVTFHLLPDVMWSDGEPFTAADIAFTVDWVQDPANNSVNQNVFEPITEVEVVDDVTATVHFAEPNPFWFDPFTGTLTGYVYPKHVLEAGPEANEAFMSQPIGTGPYVVDSFTPNDQVTYLINENYREPNKPFFSNVVIKGGSDAAAAARAVLQTGEYDFAWKLQVEPDILDSLMSEDGPGVLMEFPGVAVERLNMNFADPNKEVDGQLAEMNTPHPFFTDDAVREAMVTAVDRQKIADEFYGGGQQPATNLVNGDPMTDSPNTSWTYDPEKAAQILEDAGWAMDGDVRAKDGIELRATFAAPVSSVRQKTQAVVKSNLEEIGFKIDLIQIDSSIYFDTGAGNDQSYTHFFWDMSMLQAVPNSPRPIQSMEVWYAGPDKENIAQKSNGWTGRNTSRWANEEYDAACEAAQSAIDPQELADRFIEMNDLLVNNDVVVPLVITGEPRAASTRLRRENIALAPFSGDYWNIANWNLADDAEE